MLIKAVMLFLLVLPAIGAAAAADTKNSTTSTTAANTLPTTVTVFKVERTREENAMNILIQYQNVVEQLGDGIFTRVMLQPATLNNRKTMKVTFTGLCMGNPDVLLTVVGTFLPTLGLAKNECLEMSWDQAVNFWATCDYVQS